MDNFLVYYLVDDEAGAVTVVRVFYGAVTWKEASVQMNKSSLAIICKFT